MAEQEKTKGQKAKEEPAKIAAPSPAPPETSPAAPTPTSTPTPTPAEPTPTPTPTPAEPTQPTQVRVITKGPLGPKLLMPGTITDLPEYVALLKVKGQKKVEAVK